MLQDDGASTDVTGMDVSSRARMTAGKGSRTSPEKENPGDGFSIGKRKGESDGVMEQIWERDKPKMASTI